MHRNARGSLEMQGYHRDKTGHILHVFSYFSFTLLAVNTSVKIASGHPKYFALEGGLGWAITSSSLLMIEILWYDFWASSPWFLMGIGISAVFVCVLLSLFLTIL